MVLFIVCVINTLISISSKIAAVSPIIYTDLHSNTGITTREKAMLILETNYPRIGLYVMLFIHCRKTIPVTYTRDY